MFSKKLNVVLIFWFSGIESYVIKLYMNIFFEYGYSKFPGVNIKLENLPIKYLQWYNNIFE